MGLGAKLKEKMDMRNISQATLSKKANIPASTLSSIINRDNSKVSIDVFLRICRVLNCNPEDFSDEISTSKPETYTLTDDEQHLLDYFRNFNKEGEQEALKRLSEMAQLDCYKKRVEETNPVFIEHRKTHLLIAGKGGSADVEITNPEGLDEEVEKLKRKHNKK